MGSGMTVVGACREKGGIGAGVGISSRVGIGASSSKDVFRPLLLFGALSIVYSRGVGK